MNAALRLAQSLGTLTSDIDANRRNAFEAALTLINGVSFSKDTAALLSPADEILNSEELGIFRRLMEPNDEILQPSIKPTTYMIMKATRLCNLRCTYCHSWKDGPNQTMPFRVLAKAIRDILRTTESGHIHFVWHGGETTLLPTNYYLKALWLQYAFKKPATQISNSMQTNGTRLSHEWISFIKRMQISVGVSLDGPPEIHDSRRVDKQGRGTSAEVAKGLAALRHAGIPHGVLLVVDENIATINPEKLLSYLVDIGVKSVALLNALPANLAEGQMNVGYYTWPNFVSYLRRIFPIWWESFRFKINIRELDSLRKSLEGEPASVCEFAGDCMGQFLTIDPNGDVSACDKYIGDNSLIFGNLMSESLGKILTTSPKLLAAKAQAESVASKMSSCKFFEVCSGGCPHDMRLNSRNLISWDGDCCGLAPLFHEMNDVVSSTNSVSGKGD